MNILIVGFGTAGRYYYNLLKNLNYIENIFVTDNFDLPKIKKLKKFIFNKKNLKIYNINHAIVATPSNLHYEYSKILLENSINVLIEKPFALKIEHAKKLISLSKNKDIKCWVVFQNRYNKAIQGLKELITSKKLGKVFLVDSSLIWKRDYNYYKSSWKGRYSSDGGVLTNQAIHLLDSLFYLFGKVKKFNSILKYNKKKLDAEDLVLINMEHESGLVSTLKATTRADSNYQSALDIIGEKGRALVKGISLNTLHLFKSNKIFNILSKSENFKKGLGPIGAMGTGHKKILDEFLNPNLFKSSKEIEIYKNIHIMKVIHSVYLNNDSNNLFKVQGKQSRLGLE